MPSIAALMSPPEAEALEHFDGRKTEDERLECIEKPVPESQKPSVRMPSPDIKAPLSPPDSPWEEASQSIYGARKRKRAANPMPSPADPVLYPEDHHTTVFTPLFHQMREDAHKHTLGSTQVQLNLPVLSKGADVRTLSKAESLDLALSADCVSSIGQDFNRFPGLYLKRAKEEVESQVALAKRLRSVPKTQAFASRRHIAMGMGPQRRSASQRSPDTAAKQSSHGLPKRRAVRAPQDTTPFKRASPAKRSDPPNFNFSDIPDFSPPLSTLPNNQNCLSVDWQGNPLNLSEDSNRHLLHAAEIHLASRLRLTCAGYLCVKRRIFIGRVNNFVKGKKFTKTDAQTCGHIDVNKSSKIWMAFDRVGWFDREHFNEAIHATTRSERCFDPAQQSFVDTAAFFGRTLHPITSGPRST